jgi:glycosyltransferase involved in cell wall biosynthesis
MRIAYIFTTFPKLSEQFFLREVLELKRQGVTLELYSVFGGSDESAAGPVNRMHFADWVLLPIELLYWLFRRPQVLFGALLKLLPRGYGSWINYGENVLGIAFGLRFARKFRNAGYTSIHGTWATAPGMVVYLADQLTGMGYTLEAHAYDVFRDGGDAFLEAKLIGARAIRSSTEVTAEALRQRLSCACASSVQGMPKVHCIRRGLAGIPAYQAPKPRGVRQSLRVITVGRLIEKKGYLKQLEIYKSWQHKGIEFEAAIVGEGPLRKELRTRIDALGLQPWVQLMGQLEYQQVSELYAQSDLFLFTGVVSESGDRDGFPNVIGESMAHSLPVFTTDVSGTTEGIPNGIRGTVIDLAEPKQTADLIVAVMQDTAQLEQTTRAAYDWVVSDFQVAGNVHSLRKALWGADLASDSSRSVFP